MEILIKSLVNGVAAVPKTAAGGLAGPMETTSDLMKGTDNAIGWGNHGNHGRPGEARSQSPPPGY